MKKLMIVATVALAAAFANASSINWSANANWVDYATGAVMTEAGAPAGSFVLCYLSDGTYDTAKVVQEGTADYTPAKGNPSAKVSGNFKLTYGGDYANGDVFAVMFRDGDGNLSKIVNQSTKEDIEVLYTISGFSNDSSTLAQYKFATANYAVNVPEPTSGLLLLLGVAGMALRRRRA